MEKDFMITSESVTEGHPDKLCDQISDAIVDRFLEADPYSRIRVECAVSTGLLFIAARFSSNAAIDLPNVARHVIDHIGYVEADFNSKTCSILTSLKELPPDKRDCFNEKELSDEEIERINVKNQGTFFGFACNQSPALIPLPIYFAHKLARQIILVKRQKIMPYLDLDGKTQVGVEYKKRRPYRIYSLAITTSLKKSANVSPKQLHEGINETIIKTTFEDEEIKPDKNTKIFINPEGTLMLGGPSTHSGLTGRKNAVDTYGEYSRHSGDALSGKDPLRIDRVGAYAARYAAKNIVAAGLAEECEVQLSYTIGLCRPVSIQVETFDTAKIPEKDIIRLIKRYFDFRLAAIIRDFNLRYLPRLVRGGFYRKLAAYGHVGRMDLEPAWEKTDKVLALRKA
jgi:S-adenosylmethionine synthetase